MSFRVLVTGAHGFVGRHVTSFLAARHPNAIIISSRFDITDPVATRTVVEDAQPDVCLHLAGVSSVGQANENPSSTWNVNLHGALLLAKTIRDVNPFATYIFASSSEVYGDSFRAGTALDEHSLLAPANLYAATKAAADLALGSMARDGFQIIRARPFNHIGRGQSANFVVPAFARQLARIEAGLQSNIIRVGNLSAMRDFLDVEDVCLAYTLCIEARAELKNNSIFNFCSGTGRTIQSVLNDLISIFNVDVDVRVDTSLLRPIDVKKAIGNASLADEVLGWRPISDWNASLMRVAEFWREECRKAI